MLRTYIKLTKNELTSIKQEHMAVGFKVGLIAGFMAAMIICTLYIKYVQ